MKFMTVYWMFDDCVGEILHDVGFIWLQQHYSDESNDDQRQCRLLLFESVTAAAFSGYITPEITGKLFGT